MALHAEHPHLTANQQAIVDRPMRRVTGDASIAPGRHMLEDKRALLVGVTAETQRIHASRQINRLSFVE